MLFSNIPGMQSTPTVQRRMKGLATKIPVSCLDVLKMYNQGMGGVNFLTKEQQFTILIVNLQLDFIYILFFDLMDVACVNAFIVYNTIHQNDLTLLDYKTIVPTHLIGLYTSRSRSTNRTKNRIKEKTSLPF